MTWIFCTAKLKARPVGLRSAAPDFRAYPEGTANPTSGFVSWGCLATELCRAAKSAAYRAALVVEEVWPHITKPQFVQRRFILTAVNFQGSGTRDGEVANENHVCCTNNSDCRRYRQRFGHNEQRLQKRAACLVCSGFRVSPRDERIRLGT
jgi:hypothetical protein